MLSTLSLPGLGQIAAATALAAAGSGLAAPGATGAGDSLFPGAGNGGYQVRRYAVTLDYRPASRHLEGRTRIVARATRRLSSFSLDLEGLHVRQVTVDGRPSTFRRRGHELVVRPLSPVRGRFRATVTYDGVPRRHTDPDGSHEGWIATSDGATALNEPVGAMSWFPVNNAPRDKARYTFRVTAPSRLAVASNGRLVDRTRHGDRTTWVWREGRPMASYLALVSIGDYDVYRSTFRSVTGRRVPAWSFVGPGLGTQRAARRLLPKVLGWAERHFGAYPLRSAGLVFHDLNVGYALETQDRPFFPGKPATSTLVHELAHQWYGDGNTLKDWGDIWLNEGFATYAEWWWSGTHGGSTPAEIFRDSYDSHGPNSSLWKPAPVGFTDPADLFGSQAYERGAMTLQVLREEIGTPTFRSVLRSWGHRRHGTTRQFVALAERRSGERLDRLFHDWLYTEGKPSGY